MNVGESVEFGRLHNQLYPTRTEVDSIYPRPLVDELLQRGHNVTSLSPVGWLVRLTVLTRNVVLDINRVAAVAQAVVKEGNVIWGE